MDPDSPTGADLDALDRMDAQTPPLNGSDADEGSDLDVGEFADDLDAGDDRSSGSESYGLQATALERDDADRSFCGRARCAEAVKCPDRR